MKALVRERITDWKVRLQEKLNKPVIELTGDVNPDVQAIKKAKVIVTTPEKVRFSAVCLHFFHRCQLFFYIFS